MRHRAQRRTAYSSSLRDSPRGETLMGPDNTTTGRLRGAGGGGRLAGQHAGAPQHRGGGSGSTQGAAGGPRRWPPAGASGRLRRSGHQPGHKPEPAAHPAADDTGALSQSHSPAPGRACGARPHGVVSGLSATVRSYDDVDTLTWFSVFIMIGQSGQWAVCLHPREGSVRVGWRGIAGVGAHLRHAGRPGRVQRPPGRGP